MADALPGTSQLDRVAAVADCYRRGLSVGDIARELGLSNFTVEFDLEDLRKRGEIPLTVPLYGRVLP